MALKCSDCRFGKHYHDRCRGMGCGCSALTQYTQRGMICQWCKFDRHHHDECHNGGCQCQAPSTRPPTVSSYTVPHDPNYGLNPEDHA